MVNLDRWSERVLCSISPSSHLEEEKFNDHLEPEIEEEENGTIEECHEGSDIDAQRPPKPSSVIILVWKVRVLIMFLLKPTMKRIYIIYKFDTLNISPIGWYFFLSP